MRRYELDWLRVIVFGLLIIYHVGMFFVPWNWHIKNNVTIDWLRYPMMFINHWRLPILFVISGMGTAYALSKRSGWGFARERVHKLMIPLIIGIAFIVPPQVYIERISNGEFSGSYASFWINDAFRGIYPEGNFSWHHLWFLPYLLLFSLLLIPAFLFIRNNKGSKIVRIMYYIFEKPFRPFLLILPLYLFEAWLRPEFPPTNALWGDWYNLSRYITIFFYGFLFIYIKETFWKNVSQYRFRYLACGITSFSLFLVFTSFRWESQFSWYLIAFTRVFNMWAWILTLFGFATIYLNRSGYILRYSNEAVYPFYILHQTITVLIGFFLINLDWSPSIKFVLLIAGTFLITWLIYELLIKRIKWIRPLFGLKQSDLQNPQLMKRKKTTSEYQ